MPAGGCLWRPPARPPRPSSPPRCRSRAGGPTAGSTHRWSYGTGRACRDQPCSRSPPGAGAKDLTIRQICGAHVPRRSLRPRPDGGPRPRPAGRPTFRGAPRRAAAGRCARPRQVWECPTRFARCGTRPGHRPPAPSRASATPALPTPRSRWSTSLREVPETRERTAARAPVPAPPAPSPAPPTPAQGPLPQRPSRARHGSLLFLLMVSAPRTPRAPGPPPHQMQHIRSPRNLLAQHSHNFRPFRATEHV